MIIATLLFAPVYTHDIAFLDGSNGSDYSGCGTATSPCLSISYILGQFRNVANETQLDIVLANNLTLSSLILLNDAKYPIIHFTSVDGMRYTLDMSEGSLSSYFSTIKITNIFIKNAEINSRFIILENVKYKQLILESAE